MSRDTRKPLSCSEPLPVVPEDRIQYIQSGLEIERELQILQGEPTLDDSSVLLSVYRQIYHRLFPAGTSARFLADVLSEEVTQHARVWGRVRWFIDQLWGTIGLIRIASRFFDRLGDRTLDYVRIQQLWCSLDLLHYQLQAHHTLLSEHLAREQIPVQLLHALGSTLDEATVRIEQWTEQLGDDLTFVQRATIAAAGFNQVHYAESQK